MKPISLHLLFIPRCHELLAFATIILRAKPEQEVGGFSSAERIMVRLEAPTRYRHDPRLHEQLRDCTAIERGNKLERFAADIEAKEAELLTQHRPQRGSQHDTHRDIEPFQPSRLR